MAWDLAQYKSNVTAGLIPADARLFADDAAFQTQDTAGNVVANAVGSAYLIPDVPAYGLPIPVGDSRLLPINVYSAIDTPSPGRSTTIHTDERGYLVPFCAPVGITKVWVDFGTGRVMLTAFDAVGSSVGGNSGNGIRSLIITYAPPNVINARYDDNYAAGVLSRYDDVVIGSGLEDPSSPYYTSTTAIIQKISTLSPGTVVWGYIDCGVTTGNLSLATLQAQINQWVSIGAKGIFCDVIGYAYQVPRSRQNDIINYIHSLGVGAILNVFNPDEVLSSAVDATYNPTGIASAATGADVILLESWVCNSDAYASPFYATFSDIKTRGDKAIAYRHSIGVRVFASNIFSHYDHTTAQLQSYRDYSEAFARVWRLDGSGIAASGYSSTGADVGKVTPQFSSIKPMPLHPNAPYLLNGPWTQAEAPDIGIVVTSDSGTNTHTWIQQ